MAARDRIRHEGAGHRRLLATLLLVVATTGLGTALGLGAVLGLGGRASANLVSCASTATFGGAKPTLEVPTIDEVWTVGGKTQSKPYDSLVDVDGDGQNDLIVTFTYDDAKTAQPDGTFRLGPVADFVGTPADQLLQEQRGLDYDKSVFVPTSPVGTLLFVSVTVTQVDDARPAPAAAVGLRLTLPYTDGTDDVYELDLDTTGSTTTGSTDPHAWAHATKASTLVDDGAVHDGVGVSLETFDDQSQHVATSNLAADLTIDARKGDDRDKHVRVGLNGPLALDANGRPTAVGMPGTVAAAIANQCSTLPVETWAGLSFDGVSATGRPLVPASIDLTGSDYASGDANGDGTLDPATERTLFVQAHVDAPPPTLTITSGATQADVDGNGTLDGYDFDGIDANSDGIPDDGLPWRYVSIHHDGKTPPHVQLVLGTQSPGTGTPPTYVALDVAALPNDTSLDRAGLPGGVDLDGDGLFDDLNGDHVVDARDARANDLAGELSFCARDRSSYPGTCSTPVAATGRVRATFQDHLPPVRTDGSLPVGGGAHRPGEDVASPLPADAVRLGGGRRRAHRGGQGRHHRRIGRRAVRARGDVGLPHRHRRLGPHRGAGLVRRPAAPA
jgi:hypothetical protein